MRTKAVLAYSGGLDTSVLVHILTHDYGHDVVAVHADVGEAKDPGRLADRARQAGAVEFRFVEAKEEFARDYCFPSLVANALYQGVYPLNAALSRAMIARHLVAVAREVGATVVAHGATGKGNDQVRFDLSCRALAPELKIVAPQRERNLTRDFAIEYARRHGIEVPVTVQKPYSIDENLWGRSIEGGVLEDPAVEPPDDCFAWTRAASDCPAEPAHLRITFERGLPVAVDGERLSPARLIARVSEVAGAHGVGRIDLMEDRVIGIKSREVYEAPGALALIAAHQDLERMTCLGQVTRVKAFLDQRYAELVYEGFWFSPLREAIEAFHAQASLPVTGTVTLRLGKGAMRVVGRESPNGVYNRALATYGAEDRFDHRAAEGFIELTGLPLSLFRRLHPAG